jgi:hypothetical protein
MPLGVSFYVAERDRKEESVTPCLQSRTSLEPTSRGQQHKLRPYFIGPPNV